MTSGSADVPPTPKSAPVDWGTAIAQKAGPTAPTAARSPDPIGIELPPGGTSPDALAQETVADMQHSRGLRGKYAEKAYQLAVGCISMWAVMLGAQGVVKVALNVDMWSDKVIIAVTTGVTVSVLAAFLGVIRGLFSDAALNGSGKFKEKK